MASNPNPSLFQCTDCYEELDLQSKTLPCLHSFCRSCSNRIVVAQTKGNGQCPECHEPLTLDQLSLSPFLAKSLKRTQLESNDWKCNLCREDGIESTAINWCYDCHQLHCANCSTFHKKFHPKHNARVLCEMERDELIITTDLCYEHQKEKDSYCEQCNVCFCDKCYQHHSVDSPGCSSQPLSVGGDALRQKSQGPTLAKEMVELEVSLRRLIKRTRNYTDKLSSDCESKCQQLWKDSNDMIENIKKKTSELCEEMRDITDEQVESWRHLLKENERILKQLKVWRLNLHHLLSESQQDVDVVCGLRMLRSKLSSRLNNPVGPEEKCHLGLTFPNWWLHVLEQLKTEKIGSVSLTREKLSAVKNIHIEKEWNLPASITAITSIHVSKEDDLVFISDYYNTSIMEFTEEGDFANGNYLKEQKNSTP